jgi:transposase
MSRNHHRTALFKPYISDNLEDDPPSGNRVLTEKHEWPTPTRVRVKQMFKDGHTRHAIEKETGVPGRSQRYISTGPDRRPGKKRSGAARILANRDLRRIIRFISKSFNNRQYTWEQLANDFGNGCHPDTVQHALAEEGYHKCKACQMIWLSDDHVRNRLAFAKQHRHKPQAFWRSVRFTDETHFLMESRAAAWVIRDETERYHPTCIQYKKRGKGSQLHAWAMVGWGYKGPLVFFDSNDTSEPTDWIYQALGIENDTPEAVKETLNEEADLLGDGRPSTCKHRCKNKQGCKHACCKAGYRDLKLGGNMTMPQYLTKIFKPYIEKAWQEAKDAHHSFILLEDNDGSHGTMTTDNIVARYKRLIRIKWYANSPKSPDLNIIENVWRILKQRLKQRLRYEQAPTIDRVKEIILEIWDGIDQEEINKLVDQVPQRIDECLRRRGLNTSW